MVEFGYAMGPYEAQDLSGLDIAYANRQRQAPTRDPNRRYIPIADRMIELGKLGRKTSAGWYRYPGGGGKVEDPIVADLAIEEAHFAGITRTDYSRPGNATKDCFGYDKRRRPIFWMQALLNRPVILIWSQFLATVFHVGVVG
jgi:3-hydroxyacyl-CoA dehydrogenase